MVALVVTKKDAGMRTYTAYTKEGTPVHTVRVIDCGQGAAQALRSVVRAGFTLSSAEWACALARRFGI